MADDGVSSLYQESCHFLLETSAELDCELMRQDIC